MDDKTIEIEKAGNQSDLCVRVFVVSGPQLGAEIVLNRTCEVTVGRGTKANFRLESETSFSRLHFKLLFSGTQVKLVDLGSTNGTLLNGIPISEASIVPGDRFGIGDTMLSISLEASKGSREEEIEKDTTELFSKQSAAKPSTPKNKQPNPVRNQLAVNPPKLDKVSLGDYDLVRELGMGGMAVVFEAVHRDSKTKVAIKIIREEIGGNEKLRQLFIREATILAQLKHPYIVRSHHLGIHQQQLYLVMDYVECIDLLALIDGYEAKKKIRTACWITQRMLEALDFAHSKKIVHRDVKPSNFLAYREGRHMQIKLSDFGLAKFFEDAGLGGLTDEQSMRGTIGYMAPEQLQNAKSVGPAVDVYAVGACLYRFLTKKPPQSILNEHTKEPMASVDGVPAALQQILFRSLEREPKKRFRTAIEFAKALTPFVDKPLTPIQ